MQETRKITVPGQIWTIIAIGCVIAIVTSGPRSIMGFFLEPMTDAHGWSREGFALAIAIQNLAWGIAQPVAGMFADRYGTAKTMIFGIVLYVLGLYLMANSTEVLELTLTAGVLIGMGISFAAFFLVISSFARILPESYHGIAFGLGTAAASAGQFIYSPLGSAFLDSYGYQITLFILAGSVAIVPLLVYPFRGKSAAKADDGHDAQTVRSAIAEAFGHRSYILLLLGFFVCGYHVSFITVHLPTYISETYNDRNVGHFAIGVIGLFNIIGAILSGTAMTRIPKRYILSFIYFGRALIILAFVLTPTTYLSIMVFAGAMGLFWLSTIPPTQGLVKVMFGTRYMSMLFGFVFLSHQIGAFMGIWLGGKIYDLTGSYDLMWWSSIAAGLAAALLHWPIREQAYGTMAQPAS